NADEAHQRAIAANRWRQMREPSLSLRGLFVGADGPCHLDRVRPATHPGPGGYQEKVSASVFDRRLYGQEARQTFYEREIGGPVGRRFTDECGELAGDSPDTAPAAARDKIALLYLDGNKFGQLGREQWKASDPNPAYRRWSDELKKHHRALLKELLG